MSSQPMDNSKHKNSINTIQNDDLMQQLLVTQHFVYSRAKVISGITFCLTVIVPILINITLLFIDYNHKLAAILSLVSITLFLVSILLKNIIAKLVLHAAEIQEIFDTELFGINCVINIEADNIQKYIEKYKNKSWNRTRNWYQDYSELDKSKAVFYCQKENVDWTHTLSQRYENFIIILLSLGLILFIVNLIKYSDSFQSAVSMITIILPLLEYCCSGISKIKNDNKTMDEIIQYVSKIDNLIKNNKISDEELFDNTTKLQWMIFMYRKEKFLVPNWFDRCYCKTLENIEKRKAKHVKETLNK